MAEQEVKLMKGNEALAHAAIRCGCDGYFGYPITPQTEVIETLSELKPWETTGMVVLQAESEVASINMLYGGGGTGKRVMTSSSSPGVSLMQEGISYMAGAEVPGLIVDVQRGGPGLGTIQPSQSDYFQATRGGGNGDYYILVLAPNSVQEMADFVDLSFELAFKYRIPAMILSDGVIGQMMTFTASDSFVYNNLVAMPVRIGQIGKGGLGERIYSVYGKSVSMKANGGGGGAKTGLYKIDLPDGDYIIRKLYPIEAERLHTLPDNYTDGVSNTQRYKCIGNGWTVDVIAHILGFIPK